MSIEKRTSGAESPAPKENNAAAGNKPVLGYIIILFLAAFLLMGLSFIMHQRSNTEALGQLQNSVNALQEVQATEERVIELQQQLAEAVSKADTLEEQLEKEQQLSAKDAEQAELQRKALLGLYTLQQQYLVANMEGCSATLQAMADEGLEAYLPKEALGEATAPDVRYQQLKEAVLNHPNPPSLPQA